MCTNYKVTILHGGDFEWICSMRFVWKCMIFRKEHTNKGPPLNSAVSEVQADHMKM